MRTALILLFLLAVAAIPGSLIPQTRVDPGAVFNFKQNHPSLAPVFEQLQMFSVYTSIWFSAIYLLLMVSLVGCFVPRIRTYAKGVRNRPPKAPRNLSRLPAYATWSSTESSEEAVSRAREVLRRSRHRIEIYQRDGETVVSAERGYLREAGNLVFHVAILVILVGFAVSSLFGFKGGVAVVAGSGFSNTLTQYDQFTPGGWYNADNLKPFSFTVDDFHVRYKQTGRGAGTPLNFDADLTVRRSPDAKPYHYDLRVNHPLEIGSTGVFLVGHGYAPHITVRDATGKVAFSGPVVFIPQDSSFTSFGVVKAPDAQPKSLGFEGYFFPTARMTPQGQPYSSFPAPRNPILSMIGYSGTLGVESGVPQSVYVLDKDNMKMIKRADGKPKMLLMQPGQTVQLGKGKGSITFDGLKHYVKLQINRQPGKVIPLVGVLVAIAGLLASLFIRPRRTWVRVREQEGRTVVEVAALDRVSGGDPAAHIDRIAGQIGPPDRHAGDEEQQ